ncbi:unnamed protein product [Dibothriocephalus latus]|uniref:Uncharacterized protein n=1 Tax=Dibothriocephalus latus TaxID=60516 RepID=A0A3P7P068_DIBLA|nr:unnamed protein product [Dibothriocephalus latus]
MLIDANSYEGIVSSAYSSSPGREQLAFATFQLYRFLFAASSSSTAPAGGKSRIHSDTPLFNNIFRRQSRSSTGPGQTSCAPKSAPLDADSMLASMPVFTKPLTLLKPVAAESLSPPALPPHWKASGNPTKGM